MVLALASLISGTVISGTVMQGRTIGNTRMKVDIYGDDLGSTPLTGDRWRTAHDAFAMQVYLDGKKLGLFIRREVYGIFLRFVSEAGQNS